MWYGKILFLLKIFGRISKTFTFGKIKRVYPENLNYLAVQTQKVYQDPPEGLISIIQSAFWRPSVSFLHFCGTEFFGSSRYRAPTK